ncbi:MAG: nitrogen fixation protein NifQ [Azoarcus sp.]|jgi:nitrogen fixation protein NifQ|nr:nitrogen fixation protein NifQ [Azoarcus sp.]
MLAPLTHPRAHDALFDHLMSCATGLPNDRFVARLFVGRAFGEGILPGDLGLGNVRFAELMWQHFPRLKWNPEMDVGKRPELQIEFDDLLAFLADEADPQVISSADIARIIAVACMGANHLWQDLGLPSRQTLSQMITLNLPALARANDHDMKWKKFFYRELCQREGNYVCASPSCSVCNDYAKCFGPEE